MTDSINLTVNMYWRDFCLTSKAKPPILQDPLTPKQTEVFELACTGLKRTEIAKQLDMSLASVTDYLQKCSFKGWNPPDLIDQTVTNNN